MLERLAGDDAGGVGAGERQFAGIGFEAFSSTPEELGDFVKVQLGKWAKMIKDAGIEPE